jgi:hypothetical protein
MKNLRSTAVLFLCCSLLLTAQETDSTKSDESTASESIALWSTTGIIVPLALAGVVISAVPPSFTTVIRNGKSYGGISLETGYGIGRFRETGVFSDWRLSAGYTYVVSSKVDDIFRLELKRDFLFDFADRRKIFLAGLHLSGGMMTSFPEKGYTIGTGAWFQSPWLNYFGFFPQHYIGVAYRYNKYFTGTEFHEISLGMTSSFTF